MVWNSVGDFFHMGGYGIYVWGSVFVTFGFMFSEVLLVRSRKASVLNRMIKGRVRDLEIADDSNGSDVSDREVTKTNSESGIA